MSEPLPLQGKRVIDLSRLLPGPMASQQLAHLGAEVIKVEAPGEKDPARFIGPGGNSGFSELFRAVNRNKRFITADLKSPTGVNRILGLVESADVLIDGFRPGVLDRLGLGAPTLWQRNPALVICRITGYGQQSLFSHRAGHDLNYLAYSGVLHEAAARDGAPAMIGLQLADLLGGSQSAVIAILAALIRSQMTGAPSDLDISMTHACFTHHVMGRTTVFGERRDPVPGRELLTGGAACYNVYPASDGRLVALGALEARFWQAFCETVGRPQWIARHWTAGEVPGSDAAMATIAEVEAVFKTRSMSQWQAELESVDCCFSPVLTPSEALSHPLFRDDLTEVIEVDGQRRQAIGSTMGRGVMQPAPRPSQNAGADDGSFGA